MKISVQYRYLNVYRKLLGYGYRALKKVLRWTSGYMTYLASVIEVLRIEKCQSSMVAVTDSDDLKTYKTRWQALASRIPASFIRLYSSLSGVKSADYVPDSLYFTHLEPMLNNREYARGFADKNMYSRLIDKRFLPTVWLRKIHGVYMDEEYRMIPDVERVLSDLAGRESSVILKAAIDSQGGKSIVLLESRQGAFFSGSEKVNREWLDDHLVDNFLLQQVVKQHPFYEAFNATSLNTLRVYTYRSVKDESVHVLHTVLRVGAPGFVVDNVSSGGKACGVSSQGVLNGKAFDLQGKGYQQLGEVSSIEGTPLFRYEAIVSVAKELALQQPYSRVIGFDFCVDANERVLLIELNNFDVGVDMLQYCNGPLFGRFTDEVLAYCVRQKKHFQYQIR